MTNQETPVVFPAAPSVLANSPHTLKELSETVAAFVQEARKDSDVLTKYAENPADTLLSYAPATLQAKFSEETKEQINQIVQQTQETLDQSEEMVGGGFCKAGCTIGMWAAIVAAVGAAIAVSQGAAIAPLIAMDAGLLTVLAAITGLSEGAIAALSAAGGLTFGSLIDAACENMCG